MLLVVDEPNVQIVMGVPRPRLRPLVTRYTGYRTSGPGGVHRGMPSRALTFIVTIEGTVDLVTGNGPPRSLSALAGGLHATPVLIEHDGNQYGIHADLTPLGARALFGLPAGELADTVVDLSTLLGPTAEELVDRLRSATTWTDRFDHLDTVLAGIAGPATTPAAEVGWAWRRLAESDGWVAVGVLAAEVGWSRQHLGALFRREFGLTPKLAARVMRFEAAHRMLVGPWRPGLAEVAARSGYSDQAHFSRDWRALTGATPSTWLAEELPFVQDNAVVGGRSSRA